MGGRMTILRSVNYGVASLLAMLALSLPPMGAEGKGLESLEIFQPNYPRAGYFRVAEFLIREKYAGQEDQYAAWRDQFSDLSGIMGKVEHEELQRENPYEQIHDWFKRYKQEFPEKYVVVHFNGRGRIPTYRMEHFFAGHWLYFEGADVESDLPAEGEDIWIKVEDSNRFKLDNGRQKNSPDNITLVRRKRDGSLDWNHAEYVRLLEIGNGRIKVRRAMFGSKALEFEKGKVYAAPIIMGGPWEQTRNMVWYYNLSTECPRDPAGRNCIDVLVNELSDNFAQSGRWEMFDGVQFDVMTAEPSTGYHPSRNGKWKADCNGDGKQDHGVFDGLQTYGLGCFDFIKRLRNAVGTNKIIAADGRRPGSQKSGDFSLNGVEMEGFPEQEPFGFVAWSGSYNLLNQWKTTTSGPQFNYAAFRYNGWKDFEKEDFFRYYRLGVAATCFTDSFLMPNSWTSRDAPPRLNELFEGWDGRPVGWLGKPVSQTVHLAARSPDALKGRGKPFTSSVLRKGKKDEPWIDAEGKLHESKLKISSRKLIISPKKNSDVVAFTIRNVPYENEEVFIELRLRSAATPKGYPEGYARWIQAIGNDQPERYKIQYGYCGREWTTYRYYFANTHNLISDEPVVYNPNGEKRIDIEFRIWGPEAPVEIEYLTVHDAPEVVARKFDKGLVVANLSAKPVEFDLSADLRFGTDLSITVPAKDAVFKRLKSPVQMAVKAPNL
jgi:hypothetical protein